MLYLLQLFNPKSILFRAIAGALAIAAFFFLIHVAKVAIQKPVVEQCERDKEELKTDFKKKITESTEKAKAAYTELSNKQQDRDRTANAKIQQAKTDRDGIERELAGLRDSAPSAAAIANACTSPEKLSGLVNSYDNTLGRCEGRYIAMAERAQRAEETVRAVAPDIVQFEQEVKNFQKGLFK